MSSSSQPAQEHKNPLVVETREEGVATLALNRPDKLNALNKDLSMALNDALEGLAGDKSVSVIVITGMGRAFCAGGDLATIRKGHQENDTTELEPILRAGMQAVLKIRAMRQPVIASVNGPAAGAGMNIALAADIRIASEDASFGQNFAKVGLFPDYGGTYFLPELVGPARAAEMFYTGEMIDAQTALRLGIVNHVVPSDKLEAETKKLALQIAQGPQVVIRSVKQTLFGSGGRALAKALEHEVQEQMKCFLSEDCGEGLRAFMEKRKPQFKKTSEHKKTSNE
jgi:2-(1,2-epoxy-1,2-dihydrophenyl)acetyl-CoA isomerase